MDEEEATPKDTIRHEHRALETYTPRWFSADDLKRIDAEIRKAPFDDVEWSLTDDEGATRTSPRLDPLLDQVAYSHVTNFEVVGNQRVRGGSLGVQIVASAHLRLDRRNVYWSAGEGSRMEETRLAFRRVLDFIETLPKTSYPSKFGSPPPSFASRLRRPPEGAREWIQTVAAGVAVCGSVVTVLLKLGGAF
jgi:hypothetical protein